MAVKEFVAPTIDSGHVDLRSAGLTEAEAIVGKLKPHLHFDIAKIDLGRPWQPAPPGQPNPRDPAGDWPGDGEAAKQRVANDYLDPRAFILQHLPQA